MLSRLRIYHRGIRLFSALSKTTTNEIAGKMRDANSIPIPVSTHVVDDAVAIAILEKRRHQYLQEYPGGPIDRYLPASDPYAFLIEDSKLTESERVWQKVFVALPWLYPGIYFPAIINVKSCYNIC